MKDTYPDIPTENPFEKDFFKREKIAKNFLGIFDNFSENGFVLAIDSEWGTGKTTFVKMWETLLKTKEYNDKYHPIYYNAWGNDFLSNPFLSLFSEISEFENLDSQFNDFIKNNFNALSKSIINSFNINIPDLKTNDFLNNIRNQKNIVSKFKKILFDISENKKIIFFIDELDRCHPNFAIELLETIKHFFSVKNIIFVIVLDKSQLSNSIKVIYGENIDTDSYLRRFFDLVYKLPPPSIEFYFYNITHDLFFYNNNSDIKSKFPLLQYFLYVIIDSPFYGFSLRDLDKLKIRLVLIYNNLPTSFTNIIENICVNFLIAFLLCLSIKDDSLFKKILYGSYDTSELHNILSKYIECLNFDKEPLYVNNLLSSVKGFGYAKNLADIIYQFLSFFLKSNMNILNNNLSANYIEFKYQNSLSYFDTPSFDISKILFSENSILDIFSFTSNFEL